MLGKAARLASISKLNHIARVGQAAPKLSRVRFYAAKENDRVVEKIDSVPQTIFVLIGHQLGKKGDSGRVALVIPFLRSGLSISYIATSLKIGNVTEYIYYT